MLLINIILDGSNFKIGSFPHRSGYMGDMMGLNGHYGPDSSNIRDFLGLMPALLFGVASDGEDGKPLPYPDRMNPVVRDIMDTQRKLAPRIPGGTTIMNYNAPLIPNVCSLASLCITGNTVELPQALPALLYHCRELNGQWEDLFRNPPVLKEGQTIVEYGVDELGLPLDKSINAIRYIAMKMAYTHNYRESVNLATAGVDLSGITLRYDEMNATPRTVYLRVRNVCERFEKGVYDDFEEWHNGGRSGMFVNEFLLYWPFIMGFVRQHKKQLKPGQEPIVYENLFVGNAKKTLRKLMKSLGIKGFDENGWIPLKMKGNILTYIEPL